MHPQLPSPLGSFLTPQYCYQLSATPLPLNPCSFPHHHSLEFLSPLLPPAPSPPEPLACHCPPPAPQLTCYHPDQPIPLHLSTQSPRSLPLHSPSVSTACPQPPSLTASISHPCLCPNFCHSHPLPHSPRVCRTPWALPLPTSRSPQISSLL